jgi:hypothetical protein
MNYNKRFSLSEGKCFLASAFDVKGTGSRDRIKVSTKITTVLIGLKNKLSWFLNCQNTTLMICCHCHSAHGLSENI